MLACILLYPTVQNQPLIWMEAGLRSAMAHGELPCACLCCTNQKSILAFYFWNYLGIYMDFVTGSK